MNLLIQIFGAGKELNTLQVCARGIVIFFIALLLIRLSGRRSFGLHTPLDNIISILLGAVLSRAVTGASAFVPVISVCFLIVLLHRFFTWVLVRNKKIRELCEGKKYCFLKMVFSYSITLQMPWFQKKISCRQ